MQKSLLLQKDLVFPRLTSRERQVIDKIFPEEYPIEISALLETGRQDFKKLTISSGCGEFLLVGWKRVGFHKAYSRAVPYLIARWGNSSLKPWDAFGEDMKGPRVTGKSVALGTLIFGVSAMFFFGSLLSFLLGIVGSWLSAQYQQRDLRKRLQNFPLILKGEF